MKFNFLFRSKIKIWSDVLTFTNNSSSYLFQIFLINLASIDIVVHASAMKQILAAECSPAECIATNILGA
jgi:hypothetical protein